MVSFSNAHVFYAIQVAIRNVKAILVTTTVFASSGTRAISVTVPTHRSEAGTVDEVCKHGTNDALLQTQLHAEFMHACMILCMIACEVFDLILERFKLI